MSKEACPAAETEEVAEEDEESEEEGDKGKGKDKDKAEDKDEEKSDESGPLEFWEAESAIADSST